MKTEDIEEVLTPAQFGDWLKHQPEHSIVGLAGIADQCPIAQYLKETLEGPLFVWSEHIGPEASPWITGEWEYRAPNWVRHFTFEIDNLERCTEAGTALFVLAQVADLA